MTTEDVTKSEGRMRDIIIVIYPINYQLVPDYFLLMGVSSSDPHSSPAHFLQA